MSGSLLRVEKDGTTQVLRCRACSSFLVAGLWVVREGRSCNRHWKSGLRSNLVLVDEPEIRSSRRVSFSFSLGLGFLGIVKVDQGLSSRTAASVVGTDFRVLAASSLVVSCHSLGLQIIGWRFASDLHFPHRTPVFCCFMKKLNLPFTPSACLSCSSTTGS